MKRIFFLILFPVFLSQTAFGSFFIQTRQVITRLSHHRPNRSLSGKDMKRPRWATWLPKQASGVQPYIIISQTAFGSFFIQTRQVITRLSHHLYYLVEAHTMFSVREVRESICIQCTRCGKTWLPKQASGVQPYIIIIVRKKCCSMRSSTS